MRYIANKREELENAPNGLYAVVPPHPAYPMITPGVVFCLKQKEESDENKQINPTHPYFLIYIRDDGEIRFSFAQAKQVLEMYQVLCANVETPYKELCDLFDKQTAHGAEMGHYNDLLDKAIQSLSESYGTRAIENLLSGGFLPDEGEHINHMTDFELITWLVIL